MKFVNALLLVALRDPGAMAGLSEADWDLLLRQARAAGLLGRLGALARQGGLWTVIPVPVRRHMAAMLSIADKQGNAVRWEVQLLSRALANTRIPVVLLKGAAYAAGNLAPAAGRTFSDIDILVPKAALPEVEKRLFLAGWITTHHDAYDQRYYRQWMHELPPMTHIRRGTHLDVHHNLLPETARIKTRPDLILADARVLPGHGNIHIPGPVDQVLHSATHLYHEGEWEHGLRDLSDLDCLFRAYAGTDGFWDNLMNRAQVLNLAVPLGHALNHAQTLLHTPIPADFPAVFARKSGFPAGGRASQALFLNGFASAHSSLHGPATGIAQKLLYLRGHWLRMPMRLLLPHLLRKALSSAPASDKPG